MRNTWRRSVAALQLGIPGLILSLALACSSASTPVTPAPRVSTGTPVVDGIVQTLRQAVGEAATPTPTPTPTTTRLPKATSEETEETKEIPATASGPTDTSESIRRSDGTGGESQAPPIPDKGELKYPNLGSRLNDLVASVEAGQSTAEEAAKDAAVHRGASVAVTIYLSGNVDEVVSFLKDQGGDPRNVGGDYIEAYMPVTLLGPVSERPGVIRVREIVPPEPGRGG